MTATKQNSLRQRFASWLVQLGGVTPVLPGHVHDGLAPLGQDLFGLLDKSWGEQFQELLDARSAWRQNPLARRLVGMVTAYVVGNGVSVSSPRRELNRFAHAWWTANSMDLRLADWCDELSRSGELFVLLFPDPHTGLPAVRVRPAAVIDQVLTNPEDYEEEWAFHDGTLGLTDADASWWQSPGQAGAGQPVMLHYAVNRPLGALRGESDLAPILPWLRRYSRWLEDRVRLNAGVRAFLWVVKAPGRLRSELVERYRQPPEPGSVVITDEQESWTAVAPNLHANDAANDGRAIRWMIAAGGPGTSLLDLGEGEDSNLATGQVMVEMRRRFLRRRQTYLGWLLADVLCTAWRMANQAQQGRERRAVTIADWVVEMPDISAEDNQKLAAAAAQLASALTTVAGLVGQGPALQRVTLRWFTKFAGEQLSQEEFEAILREGGQGEKEGQREG